MKISLKEAALAYARHGWQVIPLNGKIPRTEYGYKDATTDPGIIEAWWNKWPDANVGIVTGAVSGLVVLDVDRHGEDGMKTLADLEREYGSIPSTLQVKTGGGGIHYYFRYPKEGKAPCRTRIYPGIDIKGDGGYVVAPPSLHPDTHRPYEWIPRDSVEDSERRP